ncbi:hypothetical protein ACIRL2_45990 [Embleya sp. NPDC127516]|uniref:hypothetical protein n=1 Tax=Embleya sp. NPDC127516 TaxID=3363990 RepID=UPI00381B3EFC
MNGNIGPDRARELWLVIGVLVVVLRAFVGAQRRRAIAVVETGRTLGRSHHSARSARGRGR